MLAIGCAGALGQASAAAADCPDADTEANQQGITEIEASLLCLINERRENAGVRPLQPSEQLHAAAASHSKDMVASGYFSHTSPSGKDFIDRISATGYIRGAHSWMLGENLVWGSGQLGTPGSMVEAWMESPPHRANLLRGGFRELGVAARIGTPNDPNAANGVTVTSDYGYRDTISKKARKARKKRHRKKHRHRHR